MPIVTKCPSCNANFRLADEMAGKRVKCQKCDSEFVVPQADPDEETPPKSKPAPPQSESDDDLAVSATPKKKGPPKIARKDDRDDDDEPRRRRKPRRSERPASKSGSGMSGTLMALLGAGLLSCLCCGGGVPAVYLIMQKPTPPPPPIAIADRFPDKKDKPAIFDDKKDIWPKDKFDGMMLDKMVDAFKDLAKKDFPFDKLDGFKDRPMFDAKKDRDGFKDKKVQPPAGAIGVVFGPDGTYRSDNVLNPQDPPNRTGKPHKAYVAQLQAGVTYQIDMISTDMDSYLYLFDGANMEVASDDDGGGFPNARITYRPVTSGTFRIEATVFGGINGASKFNLAIKRTGAPKVELPPPNPNPEPKKISQSILSKTSIAGAFVIKELNVSVQDGPLISVTEPCWSADGKTLYWLVNGNTLHKSDPREFKIEQTVTLLQACHHRILSGQG